jgi:signal peptidase II
MRKNLPYLLFVAALLCLDQATKWLVVREIPLFGSRQLIPGFFSLTHIRNKGAIFGFFSHSGSQGVFIALLAASITALVLVVYYFVKTPAGERGMKLALSLILAGALGNQVDRLAHGYVVDFLDVYVGTRHWPFFNVADSCISIGAVLLLIRLIARKPACTPSSSESAR